MNNELRIYYLDDSKIFRVNFERELAKINRAIDFHDFENADDLLIACNEAKPDIVFLDIEMPGKDGIWVSQQLLIMGIAFAFVTAFKDYALKAFEVSALHYIPKPVTYTEINKVIERFEKQNYASKDLLSKQLEGLSNLLGQQTLKHPKRIFVNTQKQISILQLDEIEYLQAEGSYTIFHLSNGSIITSGKNMKNFAEIILANPEYVKIHRSYIINQAQLQTINKKRLAITFVFKSGAKITVATFRRGDWEENFM